MRAIVFVPAVGLVGALLGGPPAASQGPADSVELKDGTAPSECRYQMTGDQANYKPTAPIDRNSAE